MPNDSATRNPGGRRRRVLDALVRHGLSERAAQALYTLGLLLRRRMLQATTPALPVEHAGMVDAQTGRRYGVIAIGVHRSVDVASQLQAAHGHHAASVHTHPGNSSFSPDDVHLLLEEAVLDVVAVVGADGAWYVLSAVPGALAPLVALIRPLYDATVHTLLPAYQALVYTGSLTEEQAWRELTHRTWQTLAPAFHLRYDRLT